MPDNLAKRLGRLREHDPRSRNFPARKLDTAPESAVHRHFGPILNQKDLGSCTGNAMAQCLMAGPWRLPGRTFNQKKAIQLYSLATKLDQFDGIYPPDDTGSSGLAVMKAAQELGYIFGYTHAFGIEHAKQALVIGPCIVGTNWYESMFYPDHNGEVSVQGDVVGGHEYLCLGYIDNSFIFLNSWGRSWGVGIKEVDVSGGAFWMHRDDFARLLGEYGDVTQPVTST